MKATIDQVQRKNKTMQRRKTVNNSTNCGGTSRQKHMGKLRLLAVAIGAIGAQALIAQHGLAATLDHMSYTTLPGNQQQISFKLSDPVTSPTTFQIDHPAQIAIDLMGTTNALDKRIVPVGIGNLESVDIVEANDRTRLVINLTEMTGYQTEIDGDRLIVTLDTDAEGTVIDTASAGTVIDTASEGIVIDTASEGIVIDTASAGTVVNTDELLSSSFDSNEVIEEASELPLAELLPMADVIPMEDVFAVDVVPQMGAAVAFDVAVENNQSDFQSDFQNEFQNDGLVVEMPSSLPLDYQAPDANVSDLVMPITEQEIHVETGAPIEEYIEDQAMPTARTVSPQMPRMDDTKYQSDNRQADGYKPPVANNKDVSYNGEELSLNFQDIEIRSVLQLLADFTDMNIVVSDTVQGKLTLRLKNVPWDQALDIILRTKGLDQRRSGNVVMVAPAAEIAAQETLEREAAKELIALEPLRTEFVQVNYAKATEVAAMLKTETSGTNGNITSGVLSDRGSVTIDDRTNTILVNDTADVLSKIRSLVTRLDIPVRQVLIESRIVIATDDFNREMGARFGISRDTTNDGSGITTSGNADSVAALQSNGTLDLGRFNVNLPASDQNGSIGLAFAKLPFGTLLELELSAMQAEGRGEVVSSPRVITANQREAYIEQGVEIPYQEAASSGATTTSFRKAVLGLRVKPQITPDERIIIDLTVNKDTVGEVVSDGTPTIDTREVSTQVLVANGETVVLGGIYEQSILTQRNQVPFFGDLPLVGKLFQYNFNEDDKSELLVFVTPKIVNDGSSNLDR